MHRVFYRLMLAGALTSGALLAQEPPPPPPPAPPAPAAEEARERAMAIAKIAVADTMEAAGNLALDVAHEQARIAMAKARARIEAVLAAQATPRPPVPPAPPAPPASPRAPRKRERHESPARTYERGQRALDAGRWDEALEAFTAVAAKADARADGALYWKAYTLNRLGRRDDALAAIAELRKAHPGSRWLDDARILEAEARQSSGQPVRPETEADDDLKLLALNGLVQSDPDRAVPLLENLLKTSQKPRLKERALFVLAQSNSPRGKQFLEQVARGSAGNPDLQVIAVRYIAVLGRKSDNRGLLWEIYSGSNDTEVKRAALNGFIIAKDKDHLLQVARTEKVTSLRREAISMLGAAGAQSELWGLYQQETSPEIKQQILESMVAANSSDRLAELARTEKDVKLRRSAVRALGRMPAARSGDTLLSLWAGEQDQQVKSAIIDGLAGQRNAKALVDLARKESDPRLKREMVSRLSNMKSKEAADYLLELLK